MTLKDTIQHIEHRSDRIRPWIYAFCQIAGVVTHGIGATAFVGRLVNQPLLFWGSVDIGIAKGTALCLALTGAALTLMAIRLGVVERRLAHLTEGEIETN